MQLRDAIDHLSTIRTQLAATERLRCLRAVPVALSGVMALVAATLQGVWIEDPVAAPQQWLSLWLGTALLSGLGAAIATAHRAAISASALDFAHVRLAALQFTPCLLVGAIVTAAVTLRLPDHPWVLPGLWQLLFGLGNLATHRLLPAPAVWVGALFLASGTACLWLGERALDPWAMGLPFATGQFALAAILWWHHERRGTDGCVEAER